MMRSAFRLAVLIALFCLGQAGAAELASTALFDGISSSSLLSPGSPAVWQDWDGSDWEVFSSDGNTTVQLTDNNFDDRYPQRSGSRVVWQGWDGEDWEIYQFGSNVLNRLTDNRLDDIAAHFSGANVKWQGWDGNDWEIFQFDGTIVTQLTDNRIDDRVLFASDMSAGPTGNLGNSGAHSGGSTPEPSAFAFASWGLMGVLLSGRRRGRA
jgi:hypothetical protein